MNKSDLVKYVSDKTLITERDADIIVNVFLRGIKETLEKGDKVTLKNFGSFFIQERKPRTALNPRNREIVNVPAKKVVKFKSATKLYDMVNK
jgi:DNA-binding protein HU-beta